MPQIPKMKKMGEQSWGLDKDRACMQGVSKVLLLILYNINRLMVDVCNIRCSYMCTCVASSFLSYKKGHYWPRHIKNTRQKSNFEVQWIPSKRVWI